MTTKLRIKSGDVEVEYEGSESLTALEKKLPVLLKELSNSSGNLGGSERLTKSGAKAGGSAGKTALATFLKNNNATTNQVRKFLATSIWLHDQGKDRLSTSDVPEALRNASQTRLGNP